MRLSDEICAVARGIDREVDGTFPRSQPARITTETDVGRSLSEEGFRFAERENDEDCPQNAVAAIAFSHDPNLYLRVQKNPGIENLLPARETRGVFGMRCRINVPIVFLIVNRQTDRVLSRF